MLMIDPRDWAWYIGVTAQRKPAVPAKSVPYEEQLVRLTEERVERDAQTARTYNPKG